MNNKGVSAIIDVILMVAVTVAVVSTIYYYISTSNDPLSDTTITCTIYGIAHNNTILMDNDTFVFENPEILSSFIGHNVTLKLTNSKMVWADYFILEVYLTNWQNE